MVKTQNEVKDVKKAKVGKIYGKLIVAFVGHILVSAK